MAKQFHVLSKEKKMPEIKQWHGRDCQGHPNVSNCDLYKSPRVGGTSVQCVPSPTQHFFLVISRGYLLCRFYFYFYRHVLSHRLCPNLLNPIFIHSLLFFLAAETPYTYFFFLWYLCECARCKSCASFLTYYIHSQV